MGKIKNNILVVKQEKSKGATNSLENLRGKKQHEKSCRYRIRERFVKIMC